MTTRQICQVFGLAQPAQCTGVDLWFGAITSPVQVQLRTTVAGQPSVAILAQQLIAPPAGATGSRIPVRATWAPLLLDANAEYAIVVQCADTTTSICIGQIGARDAQANQWMTAQPYQVGLFAYADASGGWVPRPDACLAFSLLRAAYAAAQQLVDVGTVALVDATDLAINADITTPEPKASATFELALDDGTTHQVDNGQRVRLPAVYTGNVAVRARLRRGSTMAAVLEPGSALVHGHASMQDDYVSPQIDATDATELRVTFKALIPPGSAVTVQMQRAGESTWTAVPYQTSTPARAGALEITHGAPLAGTAGVRIKLLLAGTIAARPMVTDLYAVTL